MAIEKRLLDKLHQLPPDQQQELLDFAEFLASRSGSRPAGWLPGFFEDVVGGWQGEPLERAPQGEPEQREEWQ